MNYKQKMYLAVFMLAVVVVGIIYVLNLYSDTVDSLPTNPYIPYVAPPLVLPTTGDTSASQAYGGTGTGGGGGGGSGGGGGGSGGGGSGGGTGDADPLGLLDGIGLADADQEQEDFDG